MLFSGAPCVYHQIKTVFLSYFYFEKVTSSKEEDTLLLLTQVFLSPWNMLREPLYVFAINIYFLILCWEHVWSSHKASWACSEFDQCHITFFFIIFPFLLESPFFTEMPCRGIGTAQVIFVAFRNNFILQKWC